MNVLEMYWEIFFFYLVIFFFLDSGGVVLVLDFEIVYVEED